MCPKGCKPATPANPGGHCVNQEETSRGNCCCCFAVEVELERVPWLVMDRERERMIGGSCVSVKQLPVLREWC